MEHKKINSIKNSDISGMHLHVTHLTETFCVLFYAAYSMRTVQCRRVGCLTNDEWKRILKEAVLT